MSTYEIPALLEVGAVENMVLVSGKNSTEDRDHLDTNESYASTSVLDVD